MRSYVLYLASAQCVFSDWGSGVRTSASSVRIVVFEWLLQFNGPSLWVLLLGMPHHAQGMPKQLSAEKDHLRSFGGL